MNAKAEEIFEPLKWLELQFEKHFHCVLGPSRAYLELYSNDGRAFNPDHVARVNYQTFRVGSSEDTPQSRANLVQTLWHAAFQPFVEKLHKDSPQRIPSDDILFWRVKPYFESTTLNGGVALRFRLAVSGHKIPGEFSGSY